MKPFAHGRVCERGRGHAAQFVALGGQHGQGGATQTGMLCFVEEVGSMGTRGVLGVPGVVPGAAQAGVQVREHHPGVLLAGGGPLRQGVDHEPELDTCVQLTPGTRLFTVCRV